MIYDIFYISDGPIDNEKWNTFRTRFPLARKLENITSYTSVKSKAFTKFFWVVWDDLEITDDFKFEYRVPEWDEKYIHVFKNGSHHNGVCLFSKDVHVSDREFKNRFFVNKKEMDIVASNYTTTEYDIIFISYQEPNADNLYNDLKMRFPRAKRVHGVKGIHQAHIEAAKLSETDMFWVVDGDAVIEPTFNFEFNDVSHGTQRLFAYIGFFLNILKDDKTLIVDELETGLHSKLSRFLITLFHNLKINKNHAQLIFSTHDTSLLDNDLFRRDQVWFMEKDTHNASKLYPLTDFSPRPTEALEKGYLQGRYGALPFFGEFKFNGQ